MTEMRYVRLNFEYCPCDADAYPLNMFSQVGMEMMFVTKKQTERECQEELVKCRDM